MSVAPLVSVDPMFPGGHPVASSTAGQIARVHRAQLPLLCFR